MFDRESVELIGLRADGGNASHSDVYPLGSQAKLVVALTALHLAGEGRLDLDRPVGEVAGGIPEPAAALTLRDLLTHHGGLPFEPPSWEPPRGGYETADLLRDLEEHPPDGERTYRYSNFGYMVAAHVIEQQLGSSFRDVADRYVRRLVPDAPGTLGFEVDDGVRRAALFTEDGGPPAETIEPYLRWSCCLLEGNVTGLAALGQHLLTTAGPEGRALAHHRARSAGWGYVGLGTFQSSDGALVYNQGAMPGSYSALALDLREQRGVAIVSGTNGRDTGGLLLRTLALLRVLRDDTAPPIEMEALGSPWQMSHPPRREAWWSLRPEAFGLEGHGILVGAPHNTTLWLRRPLPPAGSIRLRVAPLTTSVDVKIDLLAPAMGLASFGEDDVSGYRLILGGWNNTRSVLVAAPGEANVVWEASDGREGGFTPGRPIEIEIRYDPEQLAVRLDGEPYFAITRVDSGEEHRFLGFTGWASAAMVQELAIEPAEAPSTPAD